MTTSLQPSNATPVELALEHAVALITEIPNPIDTLWDPWKCPLDFLPWLAWQYSVDYWRADWPEQIKRQVIDVAYDVHRIKGTLPAIKRAVEGLGIEAEITRWFETEPKGKPYTMTVTAWTKPANSDGLVLDESGQRDLLETIDATKALRTDVSVRVGVRGGAGVSLAAAAASTRFLSARGETPQGLPARLGQAVSANAARLCEARAATPMGLRLGTAAASGGGACHLFEARMKVQ